MIGMLLSKAKDLNIPVSEITTSHAAKTMTGIGRFKKGEKKSVVMKSVLEWYDSANDTMKENCDRINIEQSDNIADSLAILITAIKDNFSTN